MPETDLNLAVETPFIGDLAEKWLGMKGNVRLRRTNPVAKKLKDGK